MDSNKENINRLKPTTRIPLPLQPLPALPRHLLKDSNAKSLENVRRPLSTINAQAAPGPSREKPLAHKPMKSHNIDARYVTLRQRSEDIDWNPKVFKDSRSHSVIIRDDDDDVNEHSKKELRYFVESRQRNCLGEARVAVTPVVKSPALEPSRVRNIKRSLKRPHSRELQGLSPLGCQEKQGGERAKRQLRFTEPVQDRLQSPDFLKKSYMKCLARDYTTDMFSYLIVVEAKPMGIPQTTSITRACVINWLMKVNGADGDPAVIQSACWYLDSILGTGHVPVDKLQLVAAACYWIALKLHGPVPPASRLVRYSNHAFTTEKLLAAEKVVLQKLKFPTQPVVAQDFINYLSWWCDAKHPGEIEVAATFLCMSGLMVDKSLCDEYPSVIAAAAVRNALLLLRKRDLMRRLQISPIYKSAEMKTPNAFRISSILRKSVRTVAANIYEYKAPLEHYGVPPSYIAQRIVGAAHDLSVMDTRDIRIDQLNVF